MKVLGHFRNFSTWIFIAVFMPVLSFAQVNNPPSPGSSGSSAGIGLDAITMLVNLSKSFPALWKLVTAGCYVIGMGLAIRAIYYLKVYGELRTMMSTQSSLKVPVTYLLVSCVFLFIPTAFQTLTMTFFGTTSPLGYEQVNSNINPVVLAALGGFVQLLGLVSFVRGWLQLVENAQSPGGGHASFGKALTHIIGGFLLLNIYGVANIVWNTFGVPFSL